MVDYKVIAKDSLMLQGITTAADHVRAVNNHYGITLTEEALPAVFTVAKANLSGLSNTLITPNTFGRGMIKNLNQTRSRTVSKTL